MYRITGLEDRGCKFRGVGVYGRCMYFGGMCLCLRACVAAWGRVLLLGGQFGGILLYGKKFQKKIYFF